jgi:hypothetical protein
MSGYVIWDKDMIEQLARWILAEREREKKNGEDKKLYEEINKMIEKEGGLYKV